MIYIKKLIIITISIFMIIILSFVCYIFIWGGKPQIKNFNDVSKDYETVANVALNYYRELSPDEEYIIIDISSNDLKHNDNILQLNESQKNSVKTTGENFEYFRICKDAVFFCRDETGYYGLVYSNNPLSAIYKADLTDDGREYHRINSHWYEWGVWGI